MRLQVTFRENAIRGILTICCAAASVVLATAKHAASCLRSDEFVGQGSRVFKDDGWTRGEHVRAAAVEAFEVAGAAGGRAVSGSRG